jgi:2-dehydropantoate 2-reductase
MTRLRIAVVGAGAIGSAFAFQLAREGGHDLTAVARPGSARLAQLERDGGIVRTTGHRAAMTIHAIIDEATPYDLVIVTLLAHQVDSVLPAFQRSAAKRIQFMFNNFDPERLRDAIGAERCLFGMPFIQAVIEPDGRLKATIGSAGQKNKMNDRTSVDIFNAAGLPAVFEPDMLLWLRCHVPLAIAFESVCVAAKRRGRGASWSESIAIARGMRECFTVIKRLGYRLYPPGKARLDATPTAIVACMLWSISRIASFRDLLATGVNECRALVDVLVVNAERADPPVSSAAIEAMKPA